jgi:hypothetical protein
MHRCPEFCSFFVPGSRIRHLMHLEPTPPFNECSDQATDSMQVAKRVQGDYPTNLPSFIRSHISSYLYECPDAMTNALPRSREIIYGLRERFVYLAAVILTGFGRSQATSGCQRSATYFPLHKTNANPHSLLPV